MIPPVLLPVAMVTKYVEFILTYVSFPSAAAVAAALSLALAPPPHVFHFNLLAAAAPPPVAETTAALRHNTIVEAGNDSSNAPLHNRRHVKVD